MSARRPNICDGSVSVFFFDPARGNPSQSHHVHQLSPPGAHTLPRSAIGMLSLLVSVCQVHASSDFRLLLATLLVLNLSSDSDASGSKFKPKLAASQPSCRITQSYWRFQCRDLKQDVPIGFKGGLKISPAKK